jgi:outer membrane protein assembly factor BamD
MSGQSGKRRLGLLLAVVLAAAFSSACLGFGHKKKQPDNSVSVAPDKVLFERAMDDIKHNRFTVARLTLQTLINTYPDSEYLAKAKLAIADSYYKEGGTSGLTQAVSEYKDFITFFPFLDEAQSAQMQVAMAHYRMMEKPDRDRTQASLAEEEFQTFLLKYPQSQLISQAQQHLREVQEVLAEGDFRVARFYYLREAYRASAARLLELTDRYPLYSQADRANWMLADTYQRAEHTDLAARYYARIVRDYPLSSMVGAAKQKLVALGYPVPQPDPGALARMQQEQEFARARPGLLHRSTGFLRSGPNVATAAHTGVPNLNPPGEEVSPTEVLQPGSGSMTVSGTAGTGSGSSVPVETVPAGSSAAPPSSSGNPPTAAGGSPAPPGGAAPAAGGSNTTGAAGANPPGTLPAANAKTQGGDPAKNPGGKKTKESSSKKKKGLRKLIPW